MYVTVRDSVDAERVAEDSTPAVARSGRRGIPAAVLALGAVSFFTDISSEAVVAILPLYLTVMLGMSPMAYGFLDGIYQGVSAAVRVLGGWWSDTSRRPKWVAAAGYGASVVARFAMIPAAGFAAITAVISLDRLGKGLRTGPRDALIGFASDPAQLGRNFGVHRSMDTAGALLGPLLAFGVLAAIPIGLGGYRSVFVMSAAFALIGLAALVLAVPDLRGPAKKPVRAPRLRLSDFAHPAIRRVLAAAGLVGLFTVGDGFIYLVLADRGSIGANYFPLLFVGTNAAYLALAVPLGQLADRIGRGKIFIGGQAFLAAAYALTASGMSGVVVVALVLACLGTFYAATDGVLAALATRAIPEERRATGVAAAQTVVALTRFCCSVLFGLLWTQLGATTALLVMLTGLVIAAPVAAVSLRGPKRDPGLAA